jgi:hypothetical protein
MTRIFLKPGQIYTPAPPFFFCSRQNMKASRILVCALALMFVSSSFAEDAPKKKGKQAKGAKGPATAMMSKLTAAVDLTAEQKDKLEKAATELNTTMATLRAEGLTPDLNKKKGEAMKKAREEGKKGKDLEAAVVASLNLTEAQQSAMKKAGEAQSTFQKTVAMILTDEQIAALPAQMQAQMKRAKSSDKPEKKAPKKKKDAA